MAARANLSAATDEYEVEDDEDEEEEDEAGASTVAQSGADAHEAKSAMATWLEQNGHGKKRVTYKLRDWLFSRQRYWGEPFPILHADDGEVIAVDESELPIALPPVDEYKPTDDGKPPLLPQHEARLTRFSFDYNFLPAGAPLHLSQVRGHGSLTHSNIYIYICSAPDRTKNMRFYTRLYL